jgi:hypothetical protein
MPRFHKRATKSNLDLTCLRFSQKTNQVTPNTKGASKLCVSVATWVALVRRRRSRGSTGKGHAYVRGGRVRAMRVVMHVWQGVKERGAGLKSNLPQNDCILKIRTPILFPLFRLSVFVAFLRIFSLSLSFFF